jgi:hypothetical protein
MVSILTGLFFHIYQKEQIAVKIAATGFKFSCPVCRIEPTFCQAQLKR